MSTLEQLATLAAAFLTAIALLVAGGRWLHRRWAPIGEKIDQALDAVVGHDAVLDKQTGAERAPAVPGIGVRMASLEEAVAGLAREDRRVSSLASDLRVFKGETTRRLTALEEAAAERFVTKLESVEGWRAVQAVAATRLTDLDDESPELDDTTQG